MFLIFKKSFFAIFIIFTFIACVKEIPSFNEESKIPSWYINAPLNSTVFIYGEGEASTISEAKENALNSMAAKLVVSVSSNTSSKTETSTNGSSNFYSKDVSKDVKIDVEKIQFTNATVEKSQQIKNNFYILMKVNRVELFENKKKEFDINDDRIETKINSLNRYAKLEQILILQTLYPQIIKAKKDTIILNAINNDFDQSPYIKKYDSYIEMIAELKNNSTFMVKTNNSKKYFADALIDILNKQQYKISNNANSDVIISLNNKVKYSLARGWNIAKVSTSISVISNNKIVSNSIISSIGRSSTSQESALENAALYFTQEINEQTLDKVIFNK